MNRLAGETSPYLLQHRDNPVDWYPWGAEAFSRAVAEQRPVMLSVGYSACHWCHVMAHESFENEEVARLLNERFVNVKVDREERPDVDAVYMDAVQAMSGHGGWPMTVFLTPDGRPFFAGTYFPPQGRGGLPGFHEVIEAVDEAWRSRREDLDSQADRLLRLISERRAPSAVPGGLTAEPLATAVDALRSSFDPRWGGFGPAPKFPQASSLDLLLARYASTGDPAALSMVTTTLAAMARGGIYDQLGGGFARYSVDSRWLVPHFEKMLYDQAALCRVYLHAWQASGDAVWLQVLEETVSYVLRDLRSPAGGLFSAEDADSEGQEGLFYLWTAGEFESVLGPEAARAARAWYCVGNEGNFEGSNVLHRPEGADLSRPPEIELARAALFSARSRRVRPGLDDKVLTEWNAMFCSSLAEAAGATGREDWARAAIEVAEFLLASLRSSEGRWLRSWQAGRARHLAYAADYAWLLDAFTRLRELTGAHRWLEFAEETAASMLELFWDDTEGGLFTTGRDAERLVLRPKETFDGSTPSANSVAAAALTRLGALTGRSLYQERAEATLKMLLAASPHPSAITHALGALDMAVAGTTEIAVVGDRPDLVRVVTQRFLPRAVLAWGDPLDSPLWAGRQEGLAYVCHGWACQAPTGDPTALAEELRTG